MKNIKYLLLLLSMLFSCGNNATKTTEYEVLYKPKYATRFELRSVSDSTILIVRDPWQGAVGQTKSYYLSGDAKRIIAMSSSHTAFLDAISCSDNVIAVSGADFLFNPTHQKKSDIGYDNALNYEKILALNSDIMTVYEVNGENNKQTDKLHDLGVNVMQIADYLEDNPLGRAEWIVVFGAMVGKMDLAQEKFDAIEARYNATKKYAAKNELKVMLNSPYRDVWYMPGDGSYMVKLLVDAGGVYLGAGVAEAKSRPISLETAYAMLLKADIWLNPSAHIGSVEQLKSENIQLKNINVPVYSNIKRNTAAGGSDFWESGVVNPDKILVDLQNILRSGGTIVDDSLFYFKKIE